MAHALITRPKVLCLDEPTISLDSESENLITNLIISLHSKSTIVVIAHRLETIKSADQIALVEEEGISRIVYTRIFLISICSVGRIA